MSIFSCRNVPASLDPFFNGDAKKTCEQLQASSPVPSRQPDYWDYFVDPSERIPLYQRIVAGAAMPIAGPLALLGSLTGCSRSSNPSAPPRSPATVSLNFDGKQIELSQELFQIEEDLPGDPALGHVLFVRDMHAPPGFSQLRPRLQEPFMRYQWSLLQLFERITPRHIFVEELTRDGGAQLVLDRLMEAGPSEAYLPNIRELRSMASVFDGGPSPDLRYFVAAVGAGSIHALRYPNDVILQRTLTPEEGIQSQRNLQDSRTCTSDSGLEDCQRLIEENATRGREDWATREVIQYLRQNRGASVVLVFGANHRFCDNFIQQNFRPRMTTLGVNLEALGYPSRLAPSPAQHCR